MSDNGVNIATATGPQIEVIPVTGTAMALPSDKRALPVSALRDANNVDISTGNPLPVGVQGAVAVTQSGSWLGVGVTNANLDAALSTLATQTTAASILSALQGTLTVGGTVTQGTAAALAGAWPVSMTDGTNVLGTSAHPVRVFLNTGGVVTSNQGNATGYDTPWPISISNGVTAIGISVGQPTYTAISDTVNLLGTSTHPLRTDPTGGTPQPVSWASAQHVIVDSASSVAVTSLPSLPAGSAVIGHVIVDSAAGVVVTSSALPTGAATSALQGAGLPAALGAGGGVKVDGSGTPLPVSGTMTANIGTAGTLALESGGNLATIAGRTPALGQALAAASSPIVLPSAQDVVAYAGSGGKLLVTETSAAASKTDLDTIAGAVSAGRMLVSLLSTVVGGAPLGQAATTGAATIVNPSDASIRIADSTPTGQAWTTTAGKQLTLTAAGTLIVSSGAGQYLRNVILINPILASAIFYFIYHGTAPTWSGAALVIANNTLIASGQITANNQANIDIPGGFAVPNGVTIVVSTVSAAATNTNYGAPGSNIYATYRSGT